MADKENSGDASATAPVYPRSVARLSAVQALYQMDIGGTGASAVLEEYKNFRLGKDIDGDTYSKADKNWFERIVRGVYEKQKEIDPLIHGSLSGDWALARIDALLRAILRAGTFEMSHCPEISAKVIMSEYIEIAKAFFAGDEFKMVNGVLDNLAHRLREGEHPKKETGEPK